MLHFRFTRLIAHRGFILILYVIYMYWVRVCISLYVLDLDYDSRMISIGQLIAVENTDWNEDREDPWCRYLEQNPESTRHRYSPGSRRRAVEDHTRKYFKKNQSAPRPSEHCLTARDASPFLAPTFEWCTAAVLMCCTVCITLINSTVCIIPGS